MPLYTVHVPHDGASAVERADSAVFVRDGFSVWAFLFGWLYLVRHRLWLPAILWLALACATALVWWQWALPQASLASLAVLAHFFVGVEGNDLRRWSLERRRFSLVDIVSAARRSDAEFAFFLRQPDEAANRPLAQTPRTIRRDMTPSVIGMFPDEGMA